jgi:HD-GYP domain-containing protein (c-di-GMP phosphodiesterase class II)
VLTLFANQAAIAVENARLYEAEERRRHENARLLDDLQLYTLELSVAYDTTLEGWGRALELRDKETHGHTRRVTDLTLQLARRLGIRESELAYVRRGVLLHDIGKMGVPDQILKKTGPLDEDEWHEMRKHPKYAYDLLYPITYLRPALDIPYSHHERWDGSGYPRGLKGDEIPLTARVFAVVDVWDALLHDRPYRKAWTREATISYLQEQSGVLFDPLVVKTFLTMLDEQL